MSMMVAFDGVSKRYWLGRTQTVVGIARERFARLAGGRRADEQREQRVLWALRDVSFGIGQGQSLGLIGRNGAGKTTLLKLINGVTWPTRGRITRQGRIISLLELGAGFHGELTARENIYLSGAIFGLRRHEVRARFDEIVAFAEVERFIDTPIKRFSSGLFARLGFSAAIHSDPDVVLMDEVLSVGDATFQRKALDKLSALVKGNATVILVSHDMRVIERVCQKTLWLDGGRVRAAGDTGEILARYGRAIEKAIRPDADETPWASAPGMAIFTRDEPGREG
jgi:ABC-type polysaccharide/polyol phosphate transport system ATPase subunit